MKALVKIAPIVIILACAASLFFSYKLNGIKTGLERDKTDLTAKLNDTTDKLTRTKKDLDETNIALKQSKDETVEVKAQLDAEKVKLTQKTQEAEELTTKVAKLEDDLKAVTADKSKAEDALAKIKDTMKQFGLEDIADIDGVRKKIEALSDENKLLAEKVKTMQAEKDDLAEKLRIAATPPAGLHGTVAVAKSNWNFIVLDVGAQDKVQKQSRFLVYRDSQLIAKAHVTSVQPNSSVAELEPQFTTSAPREGDIVIHE